MGMIALALALVLLGLEFKTSRPDGDLVQTHPYRQLMWYIMPRRNESIVYYELDFDAAPLERYLEVAGPKIGAKQTHAIVAALSIGLAESPRLNRFVMGRRLYQRRGRWLSFAVKRSKGDEKAKLSAIKMEIKDTDTFQGFCEAVNANINSERSGKKTYADREFELLGWIPRPLFLLFVPLFKLLDFYNLIPGSFIEGDAMYTSIFAANMGSVAMSGPFHHLYEWGTCPMFVTFGETEERAVVQDGEIVVKRMITARFAYDERVDDGLTCKRGFSGMVRVLSNPFEELGCLEEDGSDLVYLNAHQD